MTPERWQRVKAVLHSVLERAPAERQAFLREACAGDPELRDSVESLIASYESAGSFIEEPAVGGVTDLILGAVSDSPVGRKLGRYRVLEKLGAGGMGEVYLAEDASLGRKIALKLLPAHYASDVERLRRFKGEARSASALNHPNILTVYEVGEAEGRPFIATEFIEGETLRERMDGGRTESDETLDIAVQVASALAAAHSAGIVHRDVKPENIMIRQDGIVKVLDFGLAKLSVQRDGGTVVEAEDSTQQGRSAARFTRRTAEAETLALSNTGTGELLGTVRYMSPEQARGLAVDARTDVWSLGVVLHEMAAGRAPFEGENTGDVIDSVLTCAPPPLPQDVPAAYARVVLKCLEKDRRWRYSTASQLLEDLKALKRSDEAAASSGPTAPARRRLLTRYAIVGLALAAALATALLVYVITSRGHAPAALPEIKSIAVLPLENLSGDTDQNFFADGMTEALINELSHVGALRVISRTSVMRYKGARKPLPEVARDLKVDAVVEGTVLRSGERVRTAAKLTHAATGLQLWADSYERDRRDVLTLQQEVARDIAVEVRIKLTPQEQARLSNARPVSPAAFESYLRGRSHLDRRNEGAIRTAIPHLEEAAALDPAFALPHAALADAFFALGTVNLSALPPREALARGRAAALKAVAIDDALAEGRTALAVIKFYSWEWAEAEQEFKLAIELNPNYAPAYSWYAIYSAARGRLGEAIARIYRARDLDPLSPHIAQNVGWILHYARQYDEEIEQYERALELDPNFLFARFRLGSAYLQKGMFDQAVAEYERAIALSNRNPQALGTLGYAYALSGRRPEAQRVLGELMEMRGRRYVNPSPIIAVLLGLGRKDEAFVWLERAYQEHSYALIFLKVGDEYEPIRTDPRFVDLMRRVGLPT